MREERYKGIERGEVNQRGGEGEIYIASVGMENVNQVKRGERPLPEDIFRFTV